jgi:tight adherence protein C
VLTVAAALMAFVSVCATVLALTRMNSSPAAVRLARLGQRRLGTADGPFSERVVVPVAGGLSNAIVSLFPSKMVARISRSLDSSGRTMTTGQFLLLTVVSSLAFGIFPVFVGVLFFGKISVVALILGIPLSFIGFFLPLLMLRRRVRNRRTAVLRSLPDDCDLITLSVEAGLGLDGALRLLSQKLRGPLADEVAHSLREIALGRPRRQALEALSERVGVPELTTFVQSLVQTEQLGTSLGGVLRAQSISLRAQRRQRAQELVRKAPVKMVFPLVFFTMPTFFLVTIGPIIIRVITFLND